MHSNPVCRPCSNPCHDRKGTPDPQQAFLLSSFLRRRHGSHNLPDSRLTRKANQLCVKESMVPRRWHYASPPSSPVNTPIAYRRARPSVGHRCPGTISRSPFSWILWHRQEHSQIWTRSCHHYLSESGAFSHCPLWQISKSKGHCWTPLLALSHGHLSAHLWHRQEPQPNLDTAAITISWSPFSSSVAYWRARPYWDTAAITISRSPFSSSVASSKSTGHCWTPLPSLSHGHLSAPVWHI